MLLEVDGLEKHYTLARGSLWGKAPVLKAVDGVDLRLQRGDALGIVGESGCGKSTLARMVCALTEPTGGRVLFDEIDLAQTQGKRLRRMRKRFQIVFQNPYNSLNPRKSVRQHLEDPLKALLDLNAKQRRQRVDQVLEDVGLSHDYLDRSPKQLSGGQRQRVAIARALVLEPELLICDEVVSALDVSVKAEILNLLQSLREKYDLSMLFISHDLGVVRYVCDRVAVMYLGKVVEEGSVQDVFNNPTHPYTQALLAAAPTPRAGGSADWLNTVVTGEPPSPVDPPSGCRFRTRCSLAEDVCARELPQLLSVGSTHGVACHVRAPRPAPNLEEAPQVAATAKGLLP